MGQSIVQFTDPVQPTDPTGTVYGISYANFKKKTLTGNLYQAIRQYLSNSLTFIFY